MAAGPLASLAALAALSDSFAALLAALAALSDSLPALLAALSASLTNLEPRFALTALLTSLGLCSHLAIHSLSLSSQHS